MTFCQDWQWWGGTRLTLTLRWPAGTLREDSQDVRRSLTELMQKNANGYQAIIEASAAAAPAR